MKSKSNPETGTKRYDVPKSLKEIIEEMMANSNEPLAALLREAMVEPLKGKEVRND